METITSVLFIGAVVAGITQLVKFARAKDLEKVITICSAVAAGVLIALFDVEIGVEDITVAQGALIALGAVGVVGTAEKIG